MCHVFSFSLGHSGHSLLSTNKRKDSPLQRAHGRPDPKARRSDVITPKRGTDVPRLL